MHYKKLFNLLLGGICGVCIFFIMMLITSATSLIFQKEMYIDNSLLTIVSNSQGNSITASTFSVLMFFVIGTVISGTYKKIFCYIKKKFNKQ